MADVSRVQLKELHSGEILEEVETGTRVVIEPSLLGRPMQVAIRERDGTYYCDTPVKLLKDERRAEMRPCLERYGLAEPAATAATEEPLGVSRGE